MLFIQAIGIMGMIMNIISYQAKKQRDIILCQFFGSTFFALNFLLLGATTGCVLNIIGIVRAIIYYNKEKVKNLKLCNIIFICAYVLTYVATFTIFNKDITVFNMVEEILPVIGMTALTIGFSKKTANDVRLMTFIASPAWLIYDCLEFSVGGALCEVFTLVSAVVAIYRFKNKKEA